MYWETLPNWFWVIYYLFLVTTFGTAIFSIIKMNMKSWSIAAIAFTVTVPIISLIKSIGRAEGMNEYEHFVSHLQQGSVWTIFALTGYVYLFVWWALFFLKSKANPQATCSE
ncbi:hypothetical protein [Brevibacillus migulae]|uniref:hypothetical protein n=1 Tax=Brevibacillus migulae TaxID=1644114 RepID=UPI00106EDF68|nr:hypothetical protein [Brevibacillus migulae]